MIRHTCLVDSLCYLNRPRSLDGTETDRSRTVMFNATIVSRSSDCSYKSFGPAICTSSFDFTLLFEQTILSIAPSAIFLLFLPSRLLALRKSERKTKYTIFKGIKLVRCHPWQTSLHLTNQVISVSLFCLQLRRYHCWYCGMYTPVHRLLQVCLLHLCVLLYPLGSFFCLSLSMIAQSVLRLSSPSIWSLPYFLMQFRFGLCS